MLILDNVDDARFLDSQGQRGDSNSQSFRPLYEYLPRSQNGSTLITTRSRHAALKLVEPNDIIPVNPMDEINALDLLDKKLEKSVQRNGEDVRDLVSALECMPLAIVQAAAYISQLSPRYSVRQYIEEFHKSDRKKSNLLVHEGRDLRRDHEARNSIIISWQISFEYIRQTRESAANRLSLMSFFDSQGIPEDVIRRKAPVDDGQGSSHPKMDEFGDSEDEKSAPESSWNAEFEQDILMLRNYSLISIGKNPREFKMHKLVQLATRKWLEASEQLERWQYQFIINLNVELPTGEYENWERCQRLFPHAQSAMAQRPNGRVPLL